MFEGCRRRVALARRIALCLYHPDGQPYFVSCTIPYAYITLRLYAIYSMSWTAVPYFRLTLPNAD